MEEDLRLLGFKQYEVNQWLRPNANQNWQLKVCDENGNALYFVDAVNYVIPQLNTSSWEYDVQIYYEGKTLDLKFHSDFSPYSALDFVSKMYSQMELTSYSER